MISPTEANLMITLIDAQKVLIDKQNEVIKAMENSANIRTEQVENYETIVALLKKQIEIYKGLVK